MTLVRPASGAPGMVQVVAAAVTAGVAAHTLDHAAGSNGVVVFVLSCLAAVAAYGVVGLLAAIAGRSE